MKKTFILAFFLLFPFISLAQTDCPYGLENDPFPGECARYIDDNKDGICDYSEIEKQINTSAVGTISCNEMKTKTVAEVAEVYGIDKNQYAQALSKYLSASIIASDNFSAILNNYEIDTDTAKGIAYSLKFNPQNQTATESKSQLVQSKYIFIPILIILCAFYALSLVLVRVKKISLVAQRKIWNVLLLLTFLFCGIAGLFLVLRINYGLVINWPFNILRLHVHLGITLAVISVFHIAWHCLYYKSIIKFK